MFVHVHNYCIYVQLYVYINMSAYFLFIYLARFSPSSSLELISGMKFCWHSSTPQLPFHPHVFRFCTCWAPDCRKGLSPGMMDSLLLSYPSPCSISCCQIALGHSLQLYILKEAPLPSVSAPFVHPPGELWAPLFSLINLQRISMCCLMCFSDRSAMFGICISSMSSVYYSSIQLCIFLHIIYRIIP